MKEGKPPVMSRITISVETGIPMPIGRGGKLSAIRSALQAMKPGDSFIWEDHKAPYDAAKQLNIKITTRKVNGEGYRVWRVT